MEELAKPIVRDTMDHVQFNPDAFNVSDVAKKAKASARIKELAQPIIRGKQWEQTHSNSFYMYVISLKVYFSTYHLNEENWHNSDLH